MNRTQGWASPVTGVARTGLLSHDADEHRRRLKRLRQTERGRELTLAALVHLRDLEDTFFVGVDSVALRCALATVADRDP